MYHRISRGQKIPLCTIAAGFRSCTDSDNSFASLGLHDVTLSMIDLYCQFTIVSAERAIMSGCLEGHIVPKCLIDVALHVMSTSYD